MRQKIFHEIGIRWRWLFWSPFRPHWLLQFEAVGVRAAVVASGTILLMIIGLLYSFTSAWSQALERNKTESS